jgi:hypothetical protein
MERLISTAGHSPSLLRLQQLDKLATAYYISRAAQTTHAQTR